MNTSSHVDDTERDDQLVNPAVSYDAMKHILDFTADESAFDDVKQVLTATSNDFFPPLHERSSDNNVAKDAKSSDDVGIASYMVGFIGHHAFIHYDEKRNADAVCTYAVDYVPKPILDIQSNSEPGIYVSSVSVLPEARGHKLAQLLYSEIARLAQTKGCPIRLRTWSTNMAQIHLLDKLGYRKTLTLVNNRGTSIDTIYYQLN